MGAKLTTKTVAIACFWWHVPEDWGREEYDKLRRLMEENDALTLEEWNDLKLRAKNMGAEWCGIAGL